MKSKVALLYAMILLFLAWCAFSLRADIAKINFDQVWVAYDAIMIASALSLFNYVVRILRWSVYLSRLGHALPFSFTGLTYLAGFAFTLSPGKVGEMVRGRYYQKLGIPLSTTAAAFFVERLMDLLAMLVLVFLAFASFTSYKGLLWGLAGALILILTILAVAPWPAIAASLANTRHIPLVFKKTTESILRTLISAKILLRPSLLAIGLLLGLLAWGAEGLGLMVIGTISPAFHMDWATAVGIYSVAIIVGAVSFLPGGLGSTEAVMIAMLATRGYTMSDAILLTFVCRLLTLWFAVLIGWIAVIALRHTQQLTTITK